MFIISYITNFLYNNIFYTENNYEDTYKNPLKFVPTLETIIEKNEFCENKDFEKEKLVKYSVYLKLMINLLRVNVEKKVPQDPMQEFYKEKLMLCLDKINNYPFDEDFLSSNYSENPNSESLHEKFDMITELIEYYQNIDWCNILNLEPNDTFKVKRLKLIQELTEIITELI